MSDGLVIRAVGCSIGGSWSILWHGKFALADDFYQSYAG